MSRGRSSSPRQKDVDVDMDVHLPQQKRDAKVIIVNNLTRNVVESHLKIIFGFYGQITKVDLPLYGKCELSQLLHFAKPQYSLLDFLQLDKTEGKPPLNSRNRRLLKRRSLIWMAGNLTGQLSK